MSLAGMLTPHGFPSPRRHPRLWMVGTGVWGVVWLCQSLGVFLASGPQWPIPVALSAVDHLTWTALGLAIFAVRVPPAGGRKALATAALLAGALTTARLLGIWGLFSVVQPLPAWYVLWQLPSNLTTGVGLLVFAQAFRTFQRQATLEQVSAALEAQLSEAELRMLQMQLQPHFLFNALNSISALMRQSIASADRMLRQLEDLLRISLERTRRGMVTLRQELEFLELYLDIEQTRYQDRLRFRFEIASEALGFPVPHLILQPLVENAIRHGIAPHPDPADLLIAGHVGKDGRLHLEVRDWGAGLASGPPRKGGIGIAATRSRLAQRYGGDATFQISSPDARGTRVTLSFPQPPRSADDAGPEGAMDAADPGDVMGGAPFGPETADRSGSIRRFGPAYVLFWIGLTGFHVALRFGVGWLGAPVPTLRGAALGALGVVGCWGVIGLPALLFARRFPIRKRSGILATLAVSCATLAVYSAFHRLLFSPAPPFWQMLLTDLPYALPLVCAFVGLGNYAYYRERGREMEIGAARLRSELSAAERRMLQVQLQPTFLFDALESISLLMRVDVAAADRMLAHLGSVLRLSLGRTGGDTAAL